MTGAFLYILSCADGSYYVGTTRQELEARLAEHNAGQFDGYTARRRPVKLAFAQHANSPMQFIVAREIYKHLERITDAMEDVANEIDGIVIDHA